ncbi:MAG: hypothetical protein H0X36_03310 [Sphingomonadaceae bacterium]|nr:hypothetical protein [Sphingomonadaceae bacterium]
MAADAPGSERVAAELRRKLSVNPDDLIARHNLGVELRRLDRSQEALAEMERAIAGGLRAPETATMRAHLLADLGRYDEAVAAYRALLSAHPGMIDAHATVARLLPQIGRASEALDAYRAALAKAPEIGMLWVSALQAAKDLGDSSQLLAWADAAERRFGRDAMIAVYIAQALTKTDEDARARDILVAAVTADPAYAPARTTLAHVLIRLGDAAGAEAHALAATKLIPLDQSAWALLTVIWRLLGDAREHWLADYERLATIIDIAQPPGLAATLEALHLTTAHPADQSLRGGTQTRGNLFDRRIPEVRALADALQDGVASMLAALPRDPAHPFLGRNTGAIDFAGSWSVRLASAGFHISHIHAQGWLSSAFYVNLPLEVARGDSDAGALAFGVPDAALKLNLPPRRIVAPKKGRLVLFPSYLWHCTLPFESASPRLTVAFDALPVDKIAPAR